MAKMPEVTATGNVRDLLASFGFEDDPLKGWVSSQRTDTKAESEATLSSSPAFSDYAELLEAILSYDIPIVARQDVQLGEVIGTGYTMTVKKAVWKTQSVAAKILNVELPIATDSEAFRSQQFAEKVTQAALEIRVMSNELLRHHPNIISVLAVTFEPNVRGTGEMTMTPVLIVELATLLPDGPLTLDKYIFEASETISLPAKVRLLLDIAEGLSALHAVGVTHADLKPSNVLIFPHEHGGVRAKLNDFGFVHLDGFESRLYGGTTYWMPPECVTGTDEADLASYESVSRDVYSFGLLVWLVLFEQFPFGPPQIGRNAAADDFRFRGGYKRLLAEQFDKEFQIRLQLLSGEVQFPLSAEWIHEDDIKNLQSLEQVRYDKRKNSWVIETSCYHFLLRRTIILCLDEKPTRRKKGLNIFLDEVFTDKFLFFGLLNTHPIIGVPILTHTKKSEQRPSLDPSGTPSIGIPDEKKQPESFVRFIGGAERVGAIAYQRNPMFLFGHDAAKDVPESVQTALVRHCLFKVQTMESPDKQRFAAILAQCYTSGFGIAKDPISGTDWLAIAADSNSYRSWNLKTYFICDCLRSSLWPASFSAEKRCDWYLDALLPRLRFPESRGPQADYPRIMREKMRNFVSPDLEVILQNAFTDAFFFNQRGGTTGRETYGISQEDSETWINAARAVKRGDVSALKSIIGQDQSLLRRQEGEVTLLHIAAAADQLSLIRILLEEYHLPLTAKDSGGRTPILAALQHNAQRSFYVLYNVTGGHSQLNLAATYFNNALQGTSDALQLTYQLEVTNYAIASIDARQASKERFRVSKQSKRFKEFLKHKKGVYSKGDPAEDSESSLSDAISDTKLSFKEFERQAQQCRDACFHLSQLRNNWSVFSTHLLIGVDVELEGFSSAKTNILHWVGTLHAGHNPDPLIADLRYTPLQMAAWTCNALYVGALLSAEADVATMGAEGRTALHMACFPPRPLEDLTEWWKAGGDEDHYMVPIASDRSPECLSANRRVTLELLLHAGADQEAQESNGLTPLGYSIEFEQYDVADILLNHEIPANINFRTPTQRTALHRACLREDIAAVQYCLKNKAAIELSDIHQCTALDIAVQSGNTEISTVLLDAGARVHVTALNSSTTIHLALRASSWAIADMLLESLVTHQPEDLLSILDHHDATGLNVIGIWLLRPSAPAPLVGKILALSQLFSATSCNTLGESALHLAVLFGSGLVVINALLAARFDPNLPDKMFGWTPFHLAAYKWFVLQDNESLEVLNLISNRGGDPVLKDTKRIWSVEDILKFEATWQEDGGTLYHESAKWHRHREEVGRYLEERSKMRNEQRGKTSTPAERQVEEQKLMQQHKDTVKAKRIEQRLRRMADKSDEEHSSDDAEVSEGSHKKVPKQEQDGP